MSADFWAGYISGAAGIIIGNPLDLIKVRLQAGPVPSSSSPPSSAAFATPSSLIRGAPAPILGYGALNALLFMTYNRSLLLLSPSTNPAPLTSTFVAGALGGLATFVVSTPTELIKCRAQLSSSPDATSATILRSIFRTSGIPGLYYGGTVTALRDSIGYGFYFWSYELCTRLLSSKISASSDSAAGTEAAKVLLCGGVAGVITWASIFPLDVIKTRVQTQAWPSAETTPLLGTEQSVATQRVGALEMAKRTYKNEGATVFFRGLGVCSVRAFIVNAAQWAVYEWIMRALAQGVRGDM